MERRRRAKAAEGARIAQSHVPTQPVRYTGRIRFYVSDAYRKQHAQWRNTLSDLVDSSVGVVGPAFSIRFEASDLREWSPHCEPDQLTNCLNELAQLDPGGDDLWVVGVLGDTPRFSRSFETLGTAHLVSSHFVLRDVADLAERGAIDEAFPTHTDGQRAEMYQRRKRHKRMAVFLHEWAHTLGGLHALESDDLLHPSYDDRMASFGNANAYLITVGLEARYAQDEGKLRDYVERVEASRFAAGEHAKLLNELQRRAHTTSTPTAITTPPSDPSLSSADSELLATAQRESEQGANDDAWLHVSPLVGRYPDSRAVQQLACSLAMQLGRLPEAQTSCPRVQALSAK